MMAVKTNLAIEEIVSIAENGKVYLKFKISPEKV